MDITRSAYLKLIVSYFMLIFATLTNAHPKGGLIINLTSDLSKTSSVQNSHPQQPNPFRGELKLPSSSNLIMAPPITDTRPFSSQNIIGSLPTSTPPVGNSIASGVKSFETLLQPTMKVFNHCQVCYCKQTDQLSCKKASENFTFIPILNAEDRLKVKEIIIQNQPRFTRLDNQTLRMYPEARKLTIQDTGLKYIDEGAFEGTKLKHITLKGNKIEWTSWRMFEKLQLEELNIEGNPLPCDCTSKWIQHQINASVSYFSGSWDQITCVHPLTKKTEYIHNVAIPNCDVPRVSLDPDKKVFTEGNTSVTLNCMVEGSPQPIVYWNRRKRTSPHLNSDEYAKGVKAVEHLTGQMVNRTHNTLNLKFIRREDNGNISCVAENSVGRTVKVVSIEVKAAPQVEALYLSRCFDQCIEYVITGFPAPKVTWLHDGKLLDPGRAEHRPYALTDYMQKGSLEFTNPTRKDEGLYTLFLENSEGNSSKFVEFVLSSVPEPPKIPPLNIPLVPKDAIQDATSDETYGLDEGKYLLVVISIILIIFVISVLVSIRRRKSKRRHRKALVLKKSEKIPLNAKSIIENPNYYESEEKVAQEWGVTVISSEKVSFIESLGEGAFGKVFLGTIDYLSPEEPTTFVAVKILKNLTEEDIKEDFKREAQLLSSLNHPNIVTFYGISLSEDQLMMHFEYMQHGDLNNFLHANGPDRQILADEMERSPKVKIELKCTDLLKMAAQIAKGMKYLSDQRFVHRDLATRNCLVGENMVVKIGDFGMSRDVYATDYYRVGRQAMLPVRWMAPETIEYRKFTIESDVWSFGVVLWEIFTYGKQPYFHLSNQEVIDEILIRGNILSRPDGCIPEIYDVMLMCFQRNPADRVSFAELYHSLHSLVLKLSEDNYCTTGL